MDGRDRPVIKAYGFIESVILPDAKEGNRGRVNIVVDSLRVESFRSGVAIGSMVHGLLIVRILSTINRLEARFAQSKWGEGSWIEFQLQDSPGDPQAWYLSAENAYSGQVVRTNIISATLMEGNSFASTSIRKKLIELCRPSDAKHIRQELGNRSPQRAGQGPFVRVVDVGQASFSAIHETKLIKSRILGYFDVGGPIFFHHKTLPHVFREEKMVPTSGFVILSHWDFDHYSMAISKIPKLRELNWYAPDQPVGPNAARLQAQLGDKLTLLYVSRFIVHKGIELWKGTGINTDRNENGYAMKVNRVGGDVLLSGDLSYSFLPPGIGNQFSAIVVTHHGGAFTGFPPSPLTQGAVAAVSYGYPNRYHHPNATAIGLHQSAGWYVKSTYSSVTLRGDIWI